jgi:AcrR family transcriptional regulator
MPKPLTPKPNSPLSRQAFVDAALLVISEVGVEKMSMRKVASSLGVSAMAMYKHFPNKEELLAATLDAVIAKADVFPPADLAWQAWVERVARGMYDALCAETSWVPLLGSMRLGPQAARATEAFVNRLTHEGFSTEQAGRAYFAVIQVVIGGVCLNASIKAQRQTQMTDAQSKEQSNTSSKLTPLTLRHLEQANPKGLNIAPTLETMDQLDQLSLGLPMIIDSLTLQLAQTNS